MGSIKNLESFAFENEYGWMNAMKGRKWTQLVDLYRKEFQTVVEQKADLVTTIQNEFRATPSYTKPRNLGAYSYEMQGHQTILWRYKNIVNIAADIDIDGESLWTVEDRSDGAEQYTLAYFEKGKEKWRHTKKVGPFVATMNDRCFAIEVENYLWICRVISVNAVTGKERNVEIELDNPQWNFQMIKGTNGCLFLLANNAGAQRCWYWKKDRFVELKGFQAFVPVGFLTKNDDKPCYFGRTSKKYQAIHFKGKLPSLEDKTPEFYDPFSNLLVTKQFGERTIWKDGVAKKKLLALLDIDTLLSWRGETPEITLAKPGSYRQRLDDEPLCPYARAYRKFCRSKDGTAVPYILVSNCKPKHLLCIVYGAYGVATRLGTDRWKPLLDRGWGLCIALVRGGGDDTDAWAQAGRRFQKVKSIEDYEACIRAAQRTFRLQSESTFLYGRSAGGYTVGATLSRNTDGSLFRGVYTEVPYVDVLATTSNPDLPLTKLEYNEFGDAHRLQDAQALLRLSPIHSLPETGAPNICVLSRTGLQDKEVYAYETVKWITALKNLDKQYKDSNPKLCAIELKEGHFSSYPSLFRERAEDLAVLHSWVQDKKSHDGIYQMANTRRNRRSTRKNNVARKNRRNNVTMGGKRRRNNATARKNRRSNRK